MRQTILAIKLLFLAYLAYLFYQLAIVYDPASPGYRSPFALFVLDTIDLFLHEAGHFFCKPFGMFVYILGGSLFQVLLPLTLVIVTLRQNISTIAYPAFWLGQNMINVSVYVKDAPFRHLHLIGKGLIHDWNWLLLNNLEAAEPMGDALFATGLLVCLASIGGGVYFAIRKYREEQEEAPLL